jgi:hypothetical protein
MASLGHEQIAVYLGRTLYTVNSQVVLRPGDRVTVVSQSQRWDKCAVETASGQRLTVLIRDVRDISSG